MDILDCRPLDVFDFAENFEDINVDESFEELEQSILSILDENDPNVSISNSSAVDVKDGSMNCLEATLNSSSSSVASCIERTLEQSDCNKWKEKEFENVISSFGVLIDPEENVATNSNLVLSRTDIVDSETNKWVGLLEPESVSSFNEIHSEMSTDLSLSEIDSDVSFSDVDDSILYDSEVNEGYCVLSKDGNYPSMQNCDNIEGKGLLSDITNAAESPTSLSSKCTFSTENVLIDIFGKQSQNKFPEGFSYNIRPKDIGNVVGNADNESSSLEGPIKHFFPEIPCENNRSSDINSDNVSGSTAMQISLLPMGAVEHKFSPENRKQNSTITYVACDSEECDNLAADGDLEISSINRETVNGSDEDIIVDVCAINLSKSVNGTISGTSQLEDNINGNQEMDSGNAWDYLDSGSEKKLSLESESETSMCYDGSCAVGMLSENDTLSTVSNVERMNIGGSESLETLKLQENEANSHIDTEINDFNSTDTDHRFLCREEALAFFVLDECCFEHFSTDAECPIENEAATRNFAVSKTHEIHAVDRCNRAGLADNVPCEVFEAMPVKETEGEMDFQSSGTACDVECGQNVAPCEMPNDDDVIIIEEVFASEEKIDLKPDDSIFLNVEENILPKKSSNASYQTTEGSVSGENNAFDVEHLAERPGHQGKRGEQIAGVVEDAGSHEKVEGVTEGIDGREKADGVGSDEKAEVVIIDLTEDENSKEGSEVSKKVESFAKPDSSDGPEASPTKEAVPFKSNDPKENSDIDHPDWEIVKKLETDEERYKQVRQCWQSKTIPDPNRDLTCHSFRKKRVLSEPRKCPLPKKRVRNEVADTANNGNEQYSCDGIVQAKIDKVLQLQMQAVRSTRMRYWRESRSMEEVQARQQYQQLFLEMQQNCSLVYHPSWQRNGNFVIPPGHFLLERHKQERCQLNKWFDFQVRSVEESFRPELDALREVHKEVSEFCRFYKGLDSSSSNDPTVLTKKHVEELDEIEHMYEEFSKFYSDP